MTNKAVMAAEHIERLKQMAKDWGVIDPPDRGAIRWALRRIAEQDEALAAVATLLYAKTSQSEWEAYPATLKACVSQIFVSQKARIAELESERDALQESINLLTRARASQVVDLEYALRNCREANERLIQLAKEAEGKNTSGRSPVSEERP